jgi:CHAD domain-containing protein
MASVTPFPSGAQPEHRGLTYWMERVLKELESVRKAPDPDAVHDLRVAIRRCRSVAAVMEEVDPNPAWGELRKVARKLFRELGELRDTQVLDEWVKKLGAEGDPLRVQLQESFETHEKELREEALRVAGKFDEKAWKRLERTLRKRARLVPAGSLAAECLALERFEEAKELHARALRTEKPKPWHELRIGLKRFRYTVEGLLPEHYAAWSENLKRMQDLLGEVHDLDVLELVVKEKGSAGPEESLKTWEEMIARERHARMETYRQRTLGKTSLWNDWRHGLPQGERLEAAALARLQATALAVDTNRRRTAQVSRLALALFDALSRAHAAPVFAERDLRRVLQAAVRLHGVGATLDAKRPQKAARKFLLGLPIPPGWTIEEWELLAWAVRFHCGEEPKPKNRAFAKLSEEQQKNVRALAGVLRLAGALRKCSVASGGGIRTEKSADAMIVRVPNFNDTEENAARLAAGKHLLETYLEKPLLLKATVKRAKMVALPARAEQTAQTSAAASD